MNLILEPANVALFEFETALYEMEAAYAQLRGQFDDLMKHYHKMRRSDLDTSEIELHKLRLRMLHAHLGMRRQTANLHDMHQEHRRLIQMVETHLTRLYDIDRGGP